MTPEQRSLRASMAAHARLAKNDPKELTRAANEGRRQRFLKEVDPDGVLPIAERERRAHHAETAHMKRLAMRSAQVRRAS